MEFHSLHFGFFFFVAVIIYFSTPHGLRWAFLLVSSYYFYMSWKAEYVILIAASTLVDYFVGIRLGEETNERFRKILLGISICANLGLLFAFKYFNFFSESFSYLIRSFSIEFSAPYLNVLLPVGISFYTFQTLSYTIDVYRKKIEPQKHLGIFAVYVSFFPQLVAGPIERAKNLLPQFFEKHSLDYKRITDGLKLMMWGFFKKLVIADRLAVVVDAVFSNPQGYDGIPLMLASFFFVYQIYCDFSGYSDIAIGAAQVLGFRLMDNFRRPLFAKNVAQFWKRWHISLSSWFEDYVFMPLYFKFSSISIIKKAGYKLRHNISFITATILGLTLLGLWHGANWTFVLFGTYFGALIVLYHMNKKAWDKLPTWISIPVNFIFIIFGFILFRANNIADAAYIYEKIFSNWHLNFSGIDIGMLWPELMVSFGLIIFLEFIHILQEHVRMRQFLSDKPIWVRWPIYLAIIWGILLLGKFGSSSPFIYFQF